VEKAARVLDRLWKTRLVLWISLEMFVDKCRALVDNRPGSKQFPLQIVDNLAKTVDKYRQTVDNTGIKVEFSLSFCR